MPSNTIFLPKASYPYAQQTETIQNGMKVLEISTRSKNYFGKSLSPLNLQIILKSGKYLKVECAYQGSKVLEDGTHYPELYWGSPRDATLDRRLKDKRPVAFNFFGKEYPVNPKHAFFDWLYIIGLMQRKDDVFGKLSQYDGFSDIFYSPRKDPNCQARAAAKFLSLKREGILSNDTSSKELLEILVSK